MAPLLRETNHVAFFFLRSIVKFLFPHDPIGHILCGKSFRRSMVGSTTLWLYAHVLIIFFVAGIKTVWNIHQLLVC